MAFKLQLTDEMISFFRSSAVEDTDAGRLIRLLIDVADELPLPETVPQPLTYTLPIFIGQIENFRRNYNQKSKANAERQARFRDKQEIPPDMSRVTGVTERYETLRALQSVTGVTERYETLRALPSVTECDNVRNAQTIPDHTTPIQTTLSGGGGADGTAKEIPPPQEFKRLDGKAWSLNDYKSLAMGAGWSDEETKRFCDLNNSGRLHPVDALAAWNRNRTPTEAAGGAKAIATRKAVSNADRAKLERALTSFSELYSGTENKEAFISENVPIWLKDCPSVPSSMQAEFRQRVNDIINEERE